MKHSAFLEIRDLIRCMKSRRFHYLFLDKSVTSVSYETNNGNIITITRDKFINGYTGEYDFYAHMAKTYAKEGNLYLFRKYLILGNAMAETINRLGGDIEIFKMDYDMLRMVRGIK